ncbi:MAG: hypothetical protein PHH20_00255 [Candidatus Omnitrophica bacterium]|nr:hypothetical protein [Candidatus Omnitrophota bacterium]
MLKKALFLVLLVMVLVPAAARAADEKPIQLAIFDPIQLVPNDESIKGLGFNLIYGCNEDFYGVDLGLINRVKGRGVGLEWGAVNVDEGDFSGVQLGFVNITKGFMHGIQYGGVNISSGDSRGVEIGLVNYSENYFGGFQGGFFNYAGEMHGLQFGLVNATKNLDGLQIGLANYNGNKKPLEFMVLVNWSF